MGVHRIRVPKCSEFCEHDDPRRFAGVVRLKNRMFEFYCCPSVGCLHIGEWPERRTDGQSKEDEMREILALKMLARILKGERPWKDLEFVEELIPDRTLV